jgi:outer membrane protein OmpA-like peptidoglycan-associated protein
MKFPTTRAALLPLALSTSAFLHASAADAQVLSRFSLRAEFGAGVMTPTVQRSTLGYDGAHFQATGRIGFDVLDWLSLQLSVNNGFFLASNQLPTGRVLAVQFGLRLQPAIGTVGRLWADVNPGYYSTGSDRRLGLDAGLGFEFNLGRAVALGPVARVHWVPADRATQQPSDALYLSFGLSLTLRVPHEVAAVVLDRDHDGVLDPVDLCVDVPQGPTPDPARSGCPRPDRDGDGVYDDEDTCVDAPQGPHPDPARRGCPLPDTDGDGVFDPDDQCVTTAQGEHPDPARRGCPDGDDDNDGVLNSADLCRTVHQGLSPDPARLGCPLPDRDHDTVSDPDDRCPDQAGMPRPGTDRHGCPGEVIVTPGQIRITNPVFFATNDDVILPQSFPVLTAVRDVLQAVPGIHRVSIEGHTDDVGDDASNLALSNRRAASVMRWLVQNGIEAGRLETHGFGETRPLRPISGLRGRRLREAQAINRRVEFRITDPAPPPEAQGSAPAQAPEQAPRRRHHRHS